MGELKPGFLWFSLNRTAVLDSVSRLAEELGPARGQLASVPIERTSKERRARHALQLQIAEISRARDAEAEARWLTLRDAAVEQARIETEARAHMEMMAQRQRHERRLAEIRQTMRSRRERAAAIICALIAVASTLTALTLYLGRVRPESHRTRASAELLAAQRARADEASGLVERLQQRQKEMEKQLTEQRKAVAELRKAGKK